MWNYGFIYPFSSHFSTAIHKPIELTNHKSLNHNPLSSLVTKSIFFKYFVLASPDKSATESIVKVTLYSLPIYLLRSSPEKHFLPSS